MAGRPGPVFERLAIPDVFLHTPVRHGDARGWFAETFNAATLEPMIGRRDWVQDNHAASAQAGTVRGLHLQIAPHAQDKLVRCVRGAVCDVAVDVRVGAPTFGRHVSAVLSADNGVQIFVPKGFAHGYVTLTPDAEVIYKVTDFYNRDAERGVAWDDPALAIDWGVAPGAAILADRDRQWPALKDAGPLFTYPVAP